MDTILESLSTLPKRSLAPGETLLEEGSDGGALYFLASGAVEVTKDDVRIAEVREVAAVFGEMSVLLYTPYTATIRALVDTEVYVAEEPETFLHEYPDVMFYVAEILARRLDALNEYIVEAKRQMLDEEEHLALLDGEVDALMVAHPPESEKPESES